MTPHIYIFNSSGCHGHYLTYLVDRFSRRTPHIHDLPFNKIGNSHDEINYSGFSKLVDTWFHEKNKTLQNTNIIQILYSNDILYYERVAMARAGDADRNIHDLHKDISFIKSWNNEFYNKIHNLYSVTEDKVPKWLLRDAFKMGWLDETNHGCFVSSKKQLEWTEQNLSTSNNVHYTQVDVFFSVESLKEELLALDKKFDLDLDLKDLYSVHEQFVDKNLVLKTHKHTDTVLNAVKENRNIIIPALDIIQQAYVYAKLEMQNDFITMPMTDTFFSTTQEIIDYIKMYPEHYKAMNPNLPKFNGIDNPFFLHRQKTK